MTGSISLSLCKKNSHLWRLFLSFIAANLLSVTAFATDPYTATKHVEYPTYPTVKYDSKSDTKQIKRGEYLVKLGDCIACHTNPEGGPSFAGGYPIATPFGTIYTPNITPNKKYGIGSWKEKDFVKAMRKGISPTGSYYYPAFPYYWFNRINDKDLAAIWSYLQAIPGVDQPSLKNKMMFPFNIRLLQLGWRMMFFNFRKTGPYHPDTTQSDNWNRGRYIVDSLGHCGMCHTPSYQLLSSKLPLAAPRTKYYLAGAFVQGFFAPDITSTHFKKFSRNQTAEKLTSVFREDQLIEGGEVQGPMKEANHDSLKYLNTSDIKSIATYLKTVHSQTPPQPKHASTVSVKVGQDIYEKYCVACHTTGVGGSPKLGDAAEWDPLIKQGMNTLYKNAINGYNAMPAKGMCTSCTDQEIQSAVLYMVKQASPDSGAATGQAPKKLTSEDGKVIYEKYCAECHTPDRTYMNAPALGDEVAWKKLESQGFDVLLHHTIDGYKNMAPRGACLKCTDAELKAAIKYMLQEANSEKDYTLW